MFATRATRSHSEQEQRSRKGWTRALEFARVVDFFGAKKGLTPKLEIFKFTPLTQSQGHPAENFSHFPSSTPLTLSQTLD